MSVGVERGSVERLRQALQLFSAAERRLRGRNQRSGESLSPGHLRALFALVGENEVTAGRLAREATLNPASVTGMVDQLQARGLVRRRRDDTDRRVCWISLTDEGRAEVAEKEASWRQRLAAALADFDDRELETVSRVLDRLAAAYDRSGAEQAPSDDA